MVVVMGRRGPLPKSAELESAQGFPGRKRGKGKAQENTPKTPLQIQPTHEDSPFVPHIPYVIPRKARSIWAAIWSNPANRLTLKSTDHRVVARYCVLAYLDERDMRDPPAVTIEVTKETTYADGRTVANTQIVRNPAYQAMIERHRELRALENELGFTPHSRLAVEAKLARAPDAQASDTSRNTDAAPATSGPLGILKTGPRAN